MTGDRKIFWTVLAVVVATLALLTLVPKARDELAPEPARAWVAVEVEGSGVAKTGTLHLPAGTPFRLHAVLEATARGGDAVYYTEAPALEIGGRAVPAEALRRWDRPQPVKVLWFTVEGPAPSLALATAGDLERFHLVSFLRPEWGFGWTAAGTLEPAHDDALIAEDRQPRLPFGTQRYQVRIERFAAEGRIVAEGRWESPGGDALDAGAGKPTRVTAALPGAAGPASEVFGLTGLELAAGAGESAFAEVARKTRERTAFEQVALLAEVLATASRTPETLAWVRVGLDGELSWSEARPGDLLRVGARWVVLHADAGRPGVVDRSDLCLDFARGAAVRPLGQVFGAPDDAAAGGETSLIAAEGGLVDWAAMGENPPP